jgi:uncharacterized oligopeptide transporter (OPT) family protein
VGNIPLGCSFPPTGLFINFPGRGNPGMGGNTMIFNIAVGCTIVGLLGLLFTIPLALNYVQEKRRGNVVEKYRYWSAYQSA